MRRVQTHCILVGVALLLPICLSKTPTTLVDEECDAVKDKELLQSQGRTKETLVATNEATAAGGPMSGTMSPPVNPTKCVDIPNADVHNGQDLQIWDCNGNPAQNFQYDASDGSMRVSKQTNTCIDITSFECPDGPDKGVWSCFNAGARAQLYQCNGGSKNQKFSFQGTELGVAASLVVTSSSSSKSSGETYCVADKTGKYDNSAALTVEECTNQYKLTIPWLFGSQLRPLAVIGTDNQVCMDAADNKVENGQQMIVWTCMKQQGGLLQGNQNYYYNSADSSIRFVQFPNMCLDADANHLSVGGKIQVWSCNGGPNQQWTLENHQIKLKSKDLCVGDPTDTFAKTAALSLTSCSLWQGFNFRGIDSMDCPWKKTNSNLWDPTCGDGTSNSGYLCVQSKHGQRLMCPQNLPTMCNSQECGEGKDFCCSKGDCSNHGGERAC